MAQMFDHRGFDGARVFHDADLARAASGIQPAPTFTGPWAERIGEYRGTVWQCEMLASIIEDAERDTDTLDWAAAARYALDTDDLCELDFLIEHEARWERVQNTAQRYAPGEIPDWLLEAIMDGEA